MQTEQTKSTEERVSYIPSDINPAMARKIHSELAKGCVITKKVYNSGTSQLVDNKLFTSLFKHYEYFKQTYALLGWDLVFRESGDFFHMSRMNDSESDDADNSSIKVCVPLVVIADYIVKLGIDTVTLWNENVGVANEDLDAIVAIPHNQHVIEASGHKTIGDAVKHLKGRGIVYENAKGNVVYSSAAKYFVEQLIDRFAR
ncbi:condensin complex protein MksE [Photobacterium damselae]|uniref:condensin complex protein MksE n=1 Tax=Photobacterium damselae TaxID=38293 RepID=UPI0040685513